MASLRWQARPAVQACLLIILLARVEAQADKCEWSKTVGNKVYSFNLAAPLLLHPHGARSEDGYYKVTQEVAGSDGEEEATFWFQLCEHMKFNNAPPPCPSCPQSCGGPEHCGETCNALQAINRNGYSKCITLATVGNVSFTLMDELNPALGVSVHMNTGVMASCPEGNSSALSVHVACAGNGVVKLPTEVKKEHEGTCHYATRLVHPSGCPVVTNTAGASVGWLGIIFILLLCGAVVYFVVGLAYRILVLGVSGVEAIPNLEFWQHFPSHVQEGWAYLVEKVAGLYRTWTSSNYSRVS